MIRQADVPTNASRSMDATAASETVVRGRVCSVARAGGILQDLDLVLEASDLVGLLSLLQGIGVLVAGFLGFAQPPIRVAKMLRNRWIAAGQVDRALQLLDCFFVIALLIIDPSEAVDVKSVLGFDIERPLDQLFGLDQVDALLGVTIAEAVQPLRAGRSQLDRFLHRGPPIIALLVLIESRAHPELELVTLGTGR